MMNTPSQSSEASEPKEIKESGPGTFHRTDICRHFLNGWCSFGNECRFRHEYPDEKEIAEKQALQSEFINLQGFEISDTMRKNLKWIQKRNGQCKYCWHDVCLAQATCTFLHADHCLIKDDEAYLSQFRFSNRDSFIKFNWSEVDADKLRRVIGRSSCARLFDIRAPACNVNWCFACDRENLEYVMLRLNGWDFVCRYMKSEAFCCPNSATCIFGHGDVANMYKLVKESCVKYDTSEQLPNICWRFVEKGECNITKFPCRYTHGEEARQWREKYLQGEELPIFSVGISCICSLLNIKCDIRNCRYVHDASTAWLNRHQLL